MNPPESNYRAWIDKAESDRLNIQNNLNASKVPRDTVCFHTQQAAEKYLKSFLVYHGQEVAKTHDLVALLSRAVSIDQSMAEFETVCRRLTYYGIGARYPDELYNPSKSDAMEMVAASETVCSAVRVSLPAD